MSKMLTTNLKRYLRRNEELTGMIKLLKVLEVDDTVIDH
jgi:hypothetical protein